MERKERIQGKFCCTIFKVFIIRLYLTRGLSLMKLFLLFSLTPCSHLPKCLSSISLPFPSISLFFSVLCVHPLPLCLSALFISVHFRFIFDGSFRPLPPPPRLTPPLPISLCSYLPQVDYRTEDGTANAGSDYEFAEGTLLFKPGETLKGKNNGDTNNFWHIFKKHVIETEAQIAEVICSALGNFSQWL